MIFQYVSDVLSTFDFGPNRVFLFYVFSLHVFWLNLIQRPATTLGYRRAYSDDPKGCNLRSILTVAEDFVSI